LRQDQRALSIPELAHQPTVYTYSFIMTTLDLSLSTSGHLRGAASGADLRPIETARLVSAALHPKI